MPRHRGGQYEKINGYWYIWSDYEVADYEPAEHIERITDYNDTDADGRDLVDALQAGDFD